ncbi:MAG: C4-dicarboxylate TRAP transporter substrate-binding protein [Ectothiorhodospiraceae bacterium]|nr:C4-dicarboxylate TRAP transporter substrate-binding protein [Ectothiorhodospiraceae bacterium]
MKYSNRFLLGAASVLLSAGIALAGQASAETLRYALGYPPGSDATKAAENYAEKVSTYSDGELSVRVFPLSLLNFAETSAGVRDGIADIGYLLTAYFPSEYAHTNLIAEAAMQMQLYGDAVRGREGPAYVGAMLEYIFFNCPECHDEYAQQQQVFTGLASSSNYGLHCNAPVRTLEELQGKRVRAAGSQWSRWANEFGATPVTMSGNEALEALRQGIVDCVIISTPDLANLGIIEATTDTTIDVPGGVFAGAAITSVNRDTWQSLDDNQRGALLRAAAHISAEIPWVYHQREEEVLERAKAERGLRVHEAAPELMEATRKFVEGDMETLVEVYRDQRGVQRGAEMLDEFRPVLERWIELVSDVSSKEELAELYWTEVLSQVDPAQHGR